jgi:hypothetical protein
MKAATKIANKTDFNQASQSFDPNEAYIQTYTGVRFTQTNPKIKDIAHALSILCRFTGHVKQFLFDRATFSFNIISM